MLVTALRLLIAISVAALAFAQPGLQARLMIDANAINDSNTQALHFAGLGGSEIIYTAGNNAIGFTNSGKNGALTLIGTQ